MKITVEYTDFQGIKHLLHIHKLLCKTEASALLHATHKHEAYKMFLSTLVAGRCSITRLSAYGLIIMKCVLFILLILCCLI